MSSLITLGLVGVGGYLFIKEVWPMLKDQLEDLDFGFLGGGGGTGRGGPPPNYYPESYPQRGLQPIIEDRFPDYVVEDRYPDYVIEDRYPDYYPYSYPSYYPYPVPQYYPSFPNCPSGRYWDGNSCRENR